MKGENKMAMLKISNGEVTQIVSRGAYETLYKKLGFFIAEDGSKEVSVESKPVENDAVVVEDVNVDNTDNDAVVEDSVNDSDDFEELLEKPLSQWSNNELKSFVNAKGIDTSSAKKTSEVRSLVKKYLDNEAKNAAEV